MLSSKFQKLQSTLSPFLDNFLFKPVKTNSIKFCNQTSDENITFQKGWALKKVERVHSSKVSRVCSVALCATF